MSDAADGDADDGGDGDDEYDSARCGVRLPMEPGDRGGAVGRGGATQYVCVEGVGGRSENLARIVSH